MCKNFSITLKWTVYNFYLPYHSSRAKKAKTSQPSGDAGDDPYDFDTHDESTADEEGEVLIFFKYSSSSIFHVLPRAKLQFYQFGDFLYNSLVKPKRTFPKVIESNEELLLVTS